MRSVNQNSYIINRKNILYEKRYSIRRLAKDLGFSAIAVSQAIRCMTCSLKMHRAIANKLGVSLASFWPELYGEIENNQNNDLNCQSKDGDSYAHPSV